MSRFKNVNMLHNQYLKTCALIVIVLFFPFVKSFSQFRVQRNDQQFVLRSWNNQSGLPQNTINDIAKDEVGYLWAASEEGLIRFDGSGFDVKNESNTEGLYSSVFYDISLTGKTLWASSRNSLVRVSQNKTTTYDLRNKIDGGWITCLEASLDRKLFIGTSKGSLFYLEGDSIKLYSSWDHLRSGAIEEIRWYFDNLIIASTKGLFKLHIATGTVIPFQTLAGKHVSSLVIDAGYKIWAGTSDDGLYRLGKEPLHLTVKEGLKENFINCLALGSENEIWIGTRSSGFQIYSDGQFISPPQQKFSQDGIKSIFAENRDEVWLGSNSSGLIQMKPAQIKMLPDRFSLSENISLPIYQDKTGEAWVGTAGNGLTIISGETETTITTEQGLSDGLVLSLGGNDEYVFIGTSNGLDRYNRKLKKIDRNYKKEDGLTTNSVQAIYCDSKNRTWITTRFGGIHLLEKDKIIKKLLNKGFDNTSFLTVFEDNKGQIWFGSRGAGMLRIDNEGRLTVFNYKNGFLPDIVFSFYQDKDNIIWMGTDKGLAANDNGQFHIFDKKNGLRFNEIYKVLEDNTGFLWLSGNFGLQRIETIEAKSAIISKDTGRILSIKLFNTVDGMANSETNGGFHPAGWKMNNGELWFPSVKGVVIVDPKMIISGTRPLNIHIESLRNGAEVLNVFDEISLEPGTYNIEISYTSIDFSKANDIRYYYRLKGLNNEWILAGNRKTSYFSGLLPGNYLFEVKAEQFGNWSPAASMSFTIQPFFYQTLWFKGLVILFLTGIMIYFFKYQKRKSHRKILEQKKVTKAQLSGQEKERQVIGTELHDNINQQLATAKLYLDFARSSEEMRLPMVEKSEKVIQNVINEIRALCKAITPPTLKDIGLNDALQELISSYTLVEKFKIHFTCESNLDDLEEDLKFTLFRIIQELLNNSAKHADARNVWIRLACKDKIINLDILDDGKGYDKNKRGSGMGLANIRNRLDLYEGTFKISSDASKGLHIIITMNGETNRKKQNPIPFNWHNNSF
jgi:signal transduction histidine kinase/ligand-binding sensor domain-containing protein